MRGYSTTFAGMFDPSVDDRPTVSSIVIPIIQRDYAQGRSDQQRVRDEFLDVLIGSLVTERRAGLDFVYGEVDSIGTLRPLDGQQRLTTLFLLHWYCASRADALDLDEPWTQFAYATRPSAEFFCEELVKHRLSPDASRPSEWITDQAWYLYPWRHDPTISAMLVMLDAIHVRLTALQPDFEDVWGRLQRRDDPAISFLLLPIEDMGSGEELYIKMNSRGKPLTPFEVFKARFEAALEPSGRHAELSEKFDREWSDVLWRYESGDFAIDDEFMRYLAFIIDVSEWRRGGRSAESTLEDRARQLFATSDAAGANRDLDFLFHAFDTWVGEDPAQVLGQHFAIAGRGGDALPLFESRSADLFGACLRNYGQRFSLTESLLLFAVLVQRQFAPDLDPSEVAERLRILRNLAESAPDDVRAEFMPALIDATERLMVEGSLDDLPRFNQARVEDERRKRDFRRRYPELAHLLNDLEDHPLLRGRLYVVDLEPETIAERADLFGAVFERSNWAELTGALLACGDYSRRRSKYHQFGSSSPEKESVWRDLLTAGSREQQAALRSAVQTLLDHPLLRLDSAIPAALRSVGSEYCQRVDDGVLPRDWRYYFVKYPVMRSGASGAYVAESYDGGATRRLGYSICMLNTTTLGGYFRDPYLAAMRQLSGAAEKVTDPRFIDQWESQPRWMVLDGGTSLRCVEEGIQLRPPESPAAAARFALVSQRYGIDGRGIVSTSDLTSADVESDVLDRVQLGAELLRAMISEGL